MFLLEPGAGFSFIALQKRIQLDGEDFYINPLFYNRKLKRLVAVGLKEVVSGQNTRGRWSSISAGWKNMRARTLKGRHSAVILCAGASTRQIELLELNSAGIHVAEYLTVLPPRDVLERKLGNTIGAVRLRFECKPEGGAS